MTRALLNFGNISWFGIFICRQCHKPPANFCAQRFDGQPPVLRREEIEFQQTRLQQVAASLAVCAGIVMKRGGNLNQTLQK